ALPANPSPLELGDSLFDEGRYDEALTAYRQQDQAASASSLAAELAYKEALCLVKLRRYDEAAAALEAIKTDADPRWSIPGRVQLALIYLRRDEMPKATLLLKSLATPTAPLQSNSPGLPFAFLDPRQRLEQLAAMVPKDEVDELCGAFE